MIFTLAALTPAVVSQTSVTCVIFPAQVTQEQKSSLKGLPEKKLSMRHRRGTACRAPTAVVPNTNVLPTQESISSIALQEARSISAAFAESLLKTPTTAQLLAQGGTQPSLQTEPSTPDEQLFQPRNVPLEQLQRKARRARSAPSVSILTPSAYGQSWGSASIGLGLQERTRFSNKADGVMGFGIGLGDAQRSVGLDIGFTIVDLDTAQDGTVSFKLHRRLPDDFAVAVGVKNVIQYGETDSSTGYYGVVTKMFRLRESVEKPFSRLVVSAGVGSGQFRSELDINSTRDSVGVFGSVAVRMAEPVSAIAEWSGQDLTLGLSIIPFRNIPLVITPAVTDLTRNAGDGSRFILGIGFGMSF